MSLQKRVKKKERVLSCVVLDDSNLTDTSKGCKSPMENSYGSATEMAEIRWCIMDAFDFISM